MSNRTPPSERRAILNELRRIGKKMVGPYDERLHQRADELLWKAYQAGMFGRNKNVEFAAREQKKYYDESRRDGYVRDVAWRFSEGLLHRWYSFIVGKHLDELLACNDNWSWPIGLMEMLRALPGLIGVSENVEAIAKQLIDEKPGEPFQKWCDLFEVWGGNADRFRRDIRRQLDLLGYELVPGKGICRVPQ
jgi:hypothetical protein